MIIEKIKIGDINKNSRGTNMKVIKIVDTRYIDIQFLDDHGHIKEHVLKQNFKKGAVKNPYDKTTGGVGYIGIGKYKPILNGGIPCEAHHVWSSMIDRCYLKRDRYDPYKECEVCNEWHDYQKFSEWFENHYYSVDERLHIDKDILYPGNRMYCPEKCMLVPQRINMLFTNCKNSYGLPNGITKRKNGYKASYNLKNLGVYQTVEKAYAAYSNEKEKKIKDVANEYKNIIPSYVYDALINYKCNIFADRNYKQNS